jgi:hypothetical protein
MLVAIPPNDPSVEQGRSNAAALIVMLAVTALGFLARALTVLPADFPLNDGGLFYQMVVDLRSGEAFLPATTGYNGVDVPFAYPPLGFYLAAALHDVMGDIQVMRWLPLILATLTVPAFLLLARAMLGGAVAPVAATVAFALMPHSFEWLIMGGGITRSLGMLLGILAVWAALRLATQPTISRAALTGAVAGLTLLAHPQAALFAASGTVLILVAHRSARTLTFGGVALGIALLVAGPWLLTVLGRHGVEPFLAMGQAHPGFVLGLFRVIGFDFAGSQISHVLEALAFTGFVLALLTQRWLVPAWFVLVLVLDSRGGATYATVPGAMLAGAAVAWLVINPPWATPLATWRPMRYLRARPVSALLASAIFLAALVDGLGSQVAPDRPTASLSSEQRTPMEWIASGPARHGDHLVVTGRTWAVDATAEWFPVLTSAHSAATVQGTEWLDPGAFYRAAEASDELRRCADRPAECLDAWSLEWDVRFTHVYIPKGSVSGPLGDEDCCVALRASLREDDRYRAVYDDVGATIFERRDG